ncbi:MAG TPA: hypothetical protein VJN92_00075 [Candidatus Acidoferrum sp.]|nr:hypothetical protein [Candidatus Acidoferrum sp.]
MVKNIVSPKKPRRIVGTAPPPRLTYRGGLLIQNVAATTIFWGSAWQSDPIRAQLDSYFDFIVSSSLIDQLSEYNVPGFTIGHGKHVASLIVPQNPPATVDDTAIIAFVQKQIASGAAPAQNVNSLYFVFTPSGVTVTLQGSASCQQFCGYHDSPGGSLFYAVVPYADCPGCDFAGSVFDSMTVIASHELCEAITDPVPGSGWYDDANGEIGDICESSTRVINTAGVRAAASATFAATVSPETVVIDGTGPVSLTVTLTPTGDTPQPPPPPLPGQSYTVQTEWSNAKGACV